MKKTTVLRLQSSFWFSLMWIVLTPTLFLALWFGILVGSHDIVASCKYAGMFSIVCPATSMVAFLVSYFQSKNYDIEKLTHSVQAWKDQVKFISFGLIK